MMKTQYRIRYLTFRPRQLSTLEKVDIAIVWILATWNLVEYFLYQIRYLTFHPRQLSTLGKVDIAIVWILATWNLVEYF